MGDAVAGPGNVLEPWLGNPHVRLLALLLLDVGTAGKTGTEGHLRALLEAVDLPDGVELSQKDMPILQAAIAAEASHLITGDRKDFGRYFGQKLAGVRVMTPREYLNTRKP